MNLYLASDHAGFKMKEIISNYLKNRNIPYIDLGTDSEERASWVEYGAKGAEMISRDPGNSKGIIICGTGLGMSMVSNKFKGVRAALCTDEYTAEMSRRHNDSNVLNLGGRVLSDEKAVNIVKIWLETPFDGGRHKERLNRLKEFEERNFK